MGSAWGYSWGSAWGDSWGVVEDDLALPSTGGAGQRAQAARRRERIKRNNAAAIALVMTLASMRIT